MSRSLHFRAICNNAPVYVPPISCMERTTRCGEYGLKSIRFDCQHQENNQVSSKNSCEDVCSSRKDVSFESTNITVLSRSLQNESVTTNQGGWRTTSQNRWLRLHKQDDFFYASFNRSFSSQSNASIFNVGILSFLPADDRIDVNIRFFSSSRRYAKTPLSFLYSPSPFHLRRAVNQL